MPSLSQIDVKTASFCKLSNYTVANSIARCVVIRFGELFSLFYLIFSPPSWRLSGAVATFVARGAARWYQGVSAAPEDNRGRLVRHCLSRLRHLIGAHRRGDDRVREAVNALAGM